MRLYKKIKLMAVRFFVVLTFSLGFASCVNSLNPWGKRQDPGEDGAAMLLMLGIRVPDDLNSNGCNTELSGNTRRTVVKAVSGVNWTYCDLGSLSTVNAASTVWDLRFQRFRISTNSGTAWSGSGGSCDTGSDDFAGVKSVTCTIAIDQRVSAESGGASGSSAVEWDGAAALVQWYDYNSDTHVLTAKDRVYIIRANDGTAHYKLQMTDYYDQAGTSGYPTFRWELL